MFVFNFLSVSRGRIASIASERRIWRMMGAFDQFYVCSLATIASLSVVKDLVQSDETGGVKMLAMKLRTNVSSLVRGRDR